MIFTNCKLRDVLTSIHSGGTPSTAEKEYWGGPYKWLSSGETSQRFISDTIDTITERGIRESSTKLAKQESVVMACAGQGKTRGQTSFLLDDMYVNQSVIVLNSDKSKVLPLYLFYDLTGRYEELRGGSDASSIRGSITTTSLKTLSFRYPSIREQERIVSILYAYDSLIELNTKRIKTLEQMAENLYKEWFVRFRFPGHEKAEFENGIPKNWEVKRVKEAVNRLPFGKLYKTDDVQTEGSVIVIDQSMDEYVGFHSDEPSHIATVEDPIALFGDHSCKFQLMITPFSLSENVIPYKAKGNIELVYLFYALRGLVETTEYKRHWSEFTSKKILVASSSLQKEFVNKIIPMIELVEKIAALNRKLIKQRDLLLPRLMSGKLEV